MLITAIVGRVTVRTNKISRMTKMKILRAVILVATATAGIYALVNKDESIPRREVISAPAVSDMPQDDADTETPDANDKLNAKISAAPRIELVRKHTSTGFAPRTV